MVNGNSLILCQPNTRTFEFIKSLIQLRIINCANIEIKEKLDNILNDKDLDEKTIFDELNTIFNEVDIEEEIVNLIESSNVSKTKLLSRIKTKVDSLNPNKKENIEEIQKNLIVEKLKTSEIIDKLKNQPRIVLIADNYTVHRANLVKKACSYLNIEIVLLPTNSPHLNPIEQIWKSIKKFLSHYYLDDQKEMERLFMNEFNRIVDNNSFYNKWLYTFIEDFDYNSICYQLSDFKKCVMPIKTK